MRTVDQVIRLAIAMQGYRTLHKYLLYLVFALEGLNEIKRDGVYKIKKQEMLKVSSRKSIAWPLDMDAYSWTRIGIPVNGRILTFVPDHSLSLLGDHHKQTANLSLGHALLASSPYDSLYSFLVNSNIYFSGGPDLRNSAVGSYFAKRFHINESAREFQLDSSVSATHVYVEWIAEAKDPSCATIISKPAVRPLQEWIFYRDSRFKNGASSGETQAALTDYLSALDDAIAAQSNLTMNAIMDAVSAGTRWSIDQ